ncbi:MAG: hypothetical protein M3Y82_08640 [Verrucomicrobiota bacterium]|nr:hypothetical protein [Verrucomicrobiota bacterium]
MSYWKVILATLVIFCSGIFTGTLLSRRPSHPPPNLPPRNSYPVHLQRMEFLRKMDKQLNLTTNQHERIEKIIKKSQERTKPLYEQINPQLRDELKKVRDQIREELTPAQREKFAEVLKPKPRRPDEPPAPETRWPKLSVPNPKTSPPVEKP